MIHALRKSRATFFILAAVIVLAAPGAPTFAHEVFKAVSVTPAGRSVVSTSSPSPLFPHIDALQTSLTLSLWNSAAPTMLIAAPAPTLIPATPAISASSMPPLVPRIGMPTLAAKAEAQPFGAAASNSKPLQIASKIADGLSRDQSGSDELPPPSDAVDSLAQAPLDVDHARVYLESPSDWRDETLYSILFDRFNKSVNGKPFGDPKDGVSRHGGNIRGLIEKLDYIKASGVTTILLSPVAMSIPEAYHGYAPVHFLAVDPHLGTMADFKELVAKAQRKGLRVVLDWVINHSGPVFEYADSKTQWIGDHKPGPIEWTRTLKPIEFSEDDFSRERVITDWNDPAQTTKGDFPPNYRHFATDRPQTQAKLIHIAQWWIKETGIDGLRLDAVRHMAPGFLPRFSNEIRAYAAKLGKNNFLLLGENSTGLDDELKPFLVNGSLDTLYHYPAFRRENAALHGKAPTRALEDSRRTTQVALGDASDRLVRFINLHDTYRFLLSDTPSELLKTALAYMMTTAGIPLVYYGTEQAFRQLHGRLTPEGNDLPADPQNREDMFASGRYKSETSAGDKFDVSSASFRFLRTLADLRKAYPALTRGTQYERWSDPNGPGIYAFSRIHEGREVLVVLNTARETHSAEMRMDNDLTPVGVLLEDALNAGYAVATYAADGGSRVFVEVPAYGVRVLIRSLPSR